MKESRAIKQRRAAIVQGVCFFLLWLLPVLYLIVFHRAIPFLPRALNRLATLDGERSWARERGWDAYTALAQTTADAMRWAPLPWEGFSSRGLTGGRSRLENILAQSERQAAGTNVRQALAQHLADECALRFPHMPRVTMIRFYAQRLPVDGTAPGGWMTPPLILTDGGKSNGPRLVSTHSVGRGTRAPSPLVFKAGAEFGDEELAEMVGKSPARDFDLSGSKVTATGVSLLAKHPGLRALRLSGLPLTNENLAWLGKVETLSALDVSSTGVTDGFLEMVKGLPELAELRIGNTKLTEASGPQLGQFRNLVSLDVSGTPLLRSVLMQLGSWPKLKSLVAQKTKLERPSGFVTRHGGLSTLDLSEAIVGPDGLGVASCFPAVRNIILDGAKVADGDLGALTKAFMMETLVLSRTGVSEQGVRALLANCMSLKSIRWGREGEKTAVAPQRPLGKKADQAPKNLGIGPPKAASHAVAPKVKPAPAAPKGEPARPGAAAQGPPVLPSKALVPAPSSAPATPPKPGTPSPIDSIKKGPP